MCNRPDLTCEVSPNATPRDGNCLIHGKMHIFYRFLYHFNLAIVDAVDSYATKEQVANVLGRCTQLIEEWNVFPSRDQLRWVKGASELLSGKYCSFQNLKEIFS